MKPSQILRPIREAFYREQGLTKPKELVAWYDATDAILDNLDARLPQANGWPKWTTSPDGGVFRYSACDAWDHYDGREWAIGTACCNAYLTIAGERAITHTEAIAKFPSIARKYPLFVIGDPKDKAKIAAQARLINVFRSFCNNVPISFAQDLLEAEKALEAA